MLLATQLYLFYNFSRFHFARWNSKPRGQAEPVRRKAFNKTKKEDKKTK